MNYRSFSDLSLLIENNIQNIPWDIDLVIGVPRSGLLVANMIALLMNKTLTDLNGYLDNRLIASGKTKNVSPKLAKDCKKVLVVEDSVASGNSIIDCKEKLSSIKDVEFIFLAAYIEPGKEKLVDIYFEVLPQPRVFEWNLFHHKYVIGKSCFDIDGVLCFDPKKEQNDDGENYIRFIQNAKIKTLPTAKIDKIVTSRLEKYRSYTEEWLKKNNIEYNELIMLNATAEERREKNLHASFKAEVYKNSKDVLFIESEINQAIDINKISGKPVYCTENNYMYDGSKEYLKKESRKNGLKRFLLKFRFVRYLNKKRKNHKNGTK